MKRLVSRSLLLAGLVLAGLWGWRALLPGPEQAIRKRLDALARSASFSSKDSLLGKAYNAQQVAGFFTPDAHVIVDIPGEMQRTLNGRDDVREAALASTAMARSLKLEFGGLNIKLAPDGNSASVNLTGKVTVPGERDLVPQELNLTLQKVDGDWLIKRAETVRALQ